MKKVLIIHFSQTGQLTDILQSIAAPLQKSADISVAFARIEPKTPYKFPWGFWKFFNTFPETVYEDSPPVDITGADLSADYDLVILGYTVWFLSPSLPTIAFLKREEAKKLMAGKQVITVIGCRNMWLQAQEIMKKKLADLGARLTDNVVLIDSVHSAASFYSTPMWMVFGNKGPYFGGKIPEAGISKADIAGAARFGKAIAEQLPDRPAQSTAPMLAGLGAVKINDKLIASEKVAKRSFMLWGKLLRAIGKPSNPIRVAFIGVYFLFLLTLILTVVPLLAIIKKLIEPLTRAKIAQQHEYFAAPSGESRTLLDKALLDQGA
jgi:hypothetical protein